MSGADAGTSRGPAEAVEAGSEPSDGLDDGYCPIEDYALVGDCHGAALVSRWATVDWCCLERFDADPVFCRLLDRRRGGYLALRPRGEFRMERRYLPRTAILQTTFSTEGGRLEVTDFMPVGRDPDAALHDFVTLNAPSWFVRIVEARGGDVPVTAAYRPSVDFARRKPELRAEGDRIHAPDGPVLAADLPFRCRSDRAVARFTLSAGDRRVLVVSPDGSLLPDDPARRAGELLKVTRTFWDEWCDFFTYRGPHQEEVRRSVLTLKCLTYAPSGAIVAAPTTSLPEEIGGERNWDYRYCWIRDTAFTLDALAESGYRGEARDFADYLLRACPTSPADLRVLYGIDAAPGAEERQLDHLEGYRESRPVRVGNAAHDQLQLDIYGELLDWAYLYASIGGTLDDADEALLRGVAEIVVERWENPDRGIWEMRGESRHHTYSKIMCWVAVDRALRLFGERQSWQETREAVRRSVLEEGIHPDGGYLTLAYGEDALDAALLRVPAVGFPVGRETMARTVDAVGERLRQGPFVRRYRTGDGLSGEEGAFLVCSFWLLDALLAVDRVREAHELFADLCDCASDVGLYAEEVDPASGAFLGNFPQAFTHLAMVEAAINLRRYEEAGSDAVWGGHLRAAGRGGALGLSASLSRVWDWGSRLLHPRRLWTAPRSVLPRDWGRGREA